MKVLYFHQHFSTPDGCTGTRSYEFAKALIRAGHSVTMVCGSYWIANSGLNSRFINGTRTGVVDGIHVIELALPYSNSDKLIKRSIIFLKFSLRSVKLALRIEYDLLFATSTPLTAGIPGIIASWILNKPFVFEVRDLWPELPKAMGIVKNPLLIFMLEVLETLSYKCANRCIALAPGIAQGIRIKFPDKEIITIPNGSDSYKFDRFSNDSMEHPFTAVFSGAHGVANGLNAVLDAARELLSIGEIDIKIEFIGDGKVKPELIERCENEQLVNCKFTDPMPKIELFSYLSKNADVGLMVLENVPAFYNGTSPNKFFDYLSLQLPVLNNYPGWLAGLIEDYGCGIVVQPGNAREFAKGLVKLRNNPILLTQMGYNAKLLSEKKFSRPHLSNQFVEFLEMR